MTTTTEPTITHHAWCDPAECYIDDDPVDGCASHYGPRDGLRVNESQLTWRNATDGTLPEAVARPIDFDGHAGVEIAAGHALNIGEEQTTSGFVGVSWLTPAEARAFAEMILRAADAAEGGAR